VIAGHHVTAAEVRANTEDHTGGERFIVYNTFDRKGHPVAIIPSWTGLNDPEDDPYVYDVASPYSWGGFPPYGLGVNALHSSYQPVAVEPREVWVGWLDPAGGGGRRGRNGRLIEGAGEVLEWLLSRTSIPVDWGRCAVAIEQLRGFRLGFVLDDGAKPWEYAKEHILPLLPVSIVSGPDGLYPLVWRYGATAIDAVHRLDTTTDLGLYRASAIKVDRSKVINEFSLEYGYNIRTDTYHGKVILGADGVDPGRASMLCTLSQRRYRRPDGGPLVVSMAERTTCVYDTATAWQIVEWWAQALALGRRRVTYRGGLDRWGHVERGQVVTITDPEVGLDAQVALLESVTSDDSPTVAMGLLLLEDPARDLTRP
jgi:hypothetical protein